MTTIVIDLNEWETTPMVPEGAQYRIVERREPVIYEPEPYPKGRPGQYLVCDTCAKRFRVVDHYCPAPANPCGDCYDCPRCRPCVDCGQIPCQCH